jgi:hypothetical protein
MKAASILFLTVLGIAGLCTQPALADDISIADAPSAAVSMKATPKRFITMEQVEAQFGAPVEKMPSVGEPPITRWVYKEYTVYFEHQQVLHSVINR